ncbi:MAG: carbon-nitrogen hydrolase family protein [archaeon]|nr:carbon-nitrogen hydrolase family protein [archaeon]
MKIALVQSRGLINDPIVNFFKARMRINNVNSDIFIFPEMFCSGYIGDEARMRIGELDEKILSKLTDLSINRGCTIICGCPRKEKNELYNCAMVISGENTAMYKKMILTDDGAVVETKTFMPGNQPMIIDHMGVNIGISVGDDLFSSELCKYYAKNNADLLICISAFNEKQMDRFDKIIMSRAIENSLHIILCNMVGSDCGQNLIGRSKFIGPDGSVIERCTDSSDIRVLNIDVDALKESKNNRKIISNMEFGECIRVKTESGNGTNHKPKCPVFG